MDLSVLAAERKRSIGVNSCTPSSIGDVEICTHYPTTDCDRRNYGNIRDRDIYLSNALPSPHLNTDTMATSVTDIANL